MVDPTPDATPDLMRPLSTVGVADVQATFCATLVDEWLRRGVTHAVVAPGSRSTPMALALTAREDMSVHVVLDERSAAFVALGLGLPADETGQARPALLLCTSGTAAANFLPAVVEAGLSEVPMIVLTADRPPELRGVGAPQTIDQLDLYGRHVRWFHDAGVPDATTADRWRPLAADAVGRAERGPVHLDLPFREPLVGSPAALPAPIDGDPTGDLDASSRRTPRPVPDDFDRQRGVILVGGSSGVARESIAALHAMTQWPIIADPLSGVRDLDGVVSTADSLLRHEPFANDHAPDVIVRIGRPASSKVLAQWSARSGVTLVQVGGPGRIDPAHNVSAVCSIDDVIAAAPAGATGTTWSARWRHANELAERAIDEAIAASSRLDEPGVARTVARHSGESAVTVSSSMPVRDFEWFGGPTARAHANRGANGIDGVISTALGRALRDPGRPGVVLIGDLAFVHDSNALVGLMQRGVDLRIVIVDNDGGGIFSFLPQARSLAEERFELLFGTPLRTDVSVLAEAHGIPVSTVTTSAELVERLATSGPWVVRVPSDRSHNVEVHERIHGAVAAALTAGRSR